MDNKKAHHSTNDIGREVCWTLRLRPILADGWAPEAVDLAPPERTAVLTCVGTYPDFRLVQGSECACGAIGDGKSVLDAEPFLRSFLARQGVAAVEIVWYWGQDSPAQMVMTRVRLADFIRLNEGGLLVPVTCYVVV